MKIAVARTELHVALTQASRVAERTNTIPILRNVALDARDGGSLILGACDNIAEIRIRIPAEVERPGATTVPVGLLAALVGKMPAGQVVLDLSDDGATLTVTAGRTRARLQALPIDDFPVLATAGFGHTFGLEASSLGEALATVSTAMADEADRLYLNGAHLSCVGDGLVLVATDGYRLARWRGLLPHGAEGMPSVIVPRGTVQELARLAAAAVKGGSQAVISISDSLIRVTIAETTLTSKLVDGTYPDWQRLIPSAWPTEPIVDRAEITAAIDRVGCVLLAKDHPIRLGFADGRLTLSAQNADAGSITDDVSVSDPPADPIEIGFKARYLRDAFDAIGSETFRFCLRDSLSPAVLLPTTPDERSDRLVLLMPLRA
jgi:DNA polymerase-3 subunit beta